MDGDIVSLNSLAFILLALFVVGAGGGADVGGGALENRPLLILLKDFCFKPVVGDLHRRGETVLKCEG